MNYTLYTPKMYGLPLEYVGLCTHFRVEQEFEFTWGLTRKVVHNYTYPTQTAKSSMTYQLDNDSGAWTLQRKTQRGWTVEARFPTLEDAGEALLRKAAATGADAEELSKVIDGLNIVRIHLTNHNQG